MAETSLKVAENRYPVERVDSLNRPCYAVYETAATVEGAKLRPGVYYHGLKQSHPGDEGIPFNHRLCDPLYIEAETIDREDGSHGLLLKFRTRFGWREWVMPMQLLSGKGDEITRELLNQGHKFNRKKRAEIPDYISEYSEPERIISSTRRPGWHDEDCFVLPKQVIGSGDVRFQKDREGHPIYNEKGSLEEWKTRVGYYCQGNPVLILSVCCALAGTLLAKVGINGGGVHLVGDSSTGKSLAQLVAASVWGKPEDYAVSWNITINALENEAASRNDTVLILDEIKMARANAVQDMAYMLSNGSGKTTSTQERKSRETKRWRILTLSSGEKSLGEHASMAGNPAHAGAELRMVDVNAGTRQYRAFDDVHGMQPKVFHGTLTTNIHGQYGTVGPAFVRRLIENQHDRNLIEEFSFFREGMGAAHAQAGRVGDRFALIAQAGELAIEYGLLPWEPGTAFDACRLLFDEWVEDIGSGNSEDRQILAAIADYIDTYGNSRFADMSFNQPSAPAQELSGYFQLEDGEDAYYLFTSAGLKRAVPGFKTHRISLALKEHEALIPGGDGRSQRSVRVGRQGVKRVYKIHEAKVRAALEEQ